VGRAREELERAAGLDAMSLTVANDLTKTYTTGSVRVEALELKTAKSAA
jgi:hypothetical protein